MDYQKDKETRDFEAQEETRRHDAMIRSVSPKLKPSISPQRIKRLSKALIDLPLDVMLAP